MTVRELMDKLMEMNPDMPVYVSTGEDDLGIVCEPAELIDTALVNATEPIDPSRPWFVQPTVIEVVRIRRYF